MTAIKVENLGKSYLVGHNAAQSERYTALRDVIARNARDLARKTRDKIQGRPIGGTGGGTGDRPRFPKTPIQIPR